MSTTPGESIGPEKAPDLPELPEAEGGSVEADEPDGSGPAAPGDPEQQGSPVLDDAGQPLPGEPGEPSS